MTWTRPAVCLFQAGTVALFCLGCESAAVRKVNNAAIAARMSRTDPVSRMLIRQSFTRLPQRYQDYRVGPRDVLEVSIFEWELSEQTKTERFRVSETGQISLPVIGILHVGGSTVEQIKELIENRLKEGGFIRNPRLSVSVIEYRSRRIAVVGSVKDPGVYTIRQNVTTLMEILFLAGGLSDKAGQVVHVIRVPQAERKAEREAAALQQTVRRAKAKGGAAVLAPPKTPSPDAPAKTARKRPERTTVTIDLYELMDKGDLSLNMVLTDGDVVQVPEAERFAVMGFVREPGSFVLRRDTTVLEAVALARGLQEKEASPSDCTLKRTTAKGVEIIPLDLVAISDGEAKNLHIEPNDIVNVRQTLGKKIYLTALDLVGRVVTVGYSIKLNE